MVKFPLFILKETIYMFVSDISLYNIFEGLDENESSLILKISQKKRLAQGNYLFRKDNPRDRIFLMYEGEVEISHKANEEIVLEKITKRDAIGELALYAHTPWSANAKATTDIIFWEVHTEDIFYLFEENTKVGMTVLSNLEKLIASRHKNTDIELRKSLLWTKMQSNPPKE